MRKIFAFLAVVVVLVSCKGNEELDEKRALQEQVVETETISGTDTVLTRYEYDHKGRLSKIITDSLAWVKLEYYSNGDLAVVDRISKYPTARFRRYAVFSYADSGKLRSAILKMYENDILETTVQLGYTLDSGKVKVVSSSNPEVFPSEAVTYDRNGNVSKLVQEGLITTTQLFTHSDKKSPFVNAKLRYYFGDFDFLSGIQDVNSRLSRTITSSYKIEESIISEYNQSGFPIASKATRVIDTYQEEISTSFRYDLK